MSSSGKDSSDSFFESFGNSPAKPATSATVQRRAPPPPPPPPQRAAAPTAGVSSSSGRPSYYGSNAPAASSKLPPANGYRSTVAPTRSAPSATTSAFPYGAAPLPSTSAAPAAPYYTTPVGAPPNAASTTSSYYSMTASTTPTTTTAANDADWYSGETSMPSSPVPAPAPSFVMSNQYTVNSQLMESSSSLEGVMDNSAPVAPQPTLFVPSATSSSNYLVDDFANEPPLLEELGINLEHILLKTKAVVIPFRRFAGNTALMDPTMIVEDADLAGPLVLALLLGGELLLSGKIHFGYIYGFGLFGCLAMTLILNLMSPNQAVSVWTVASILGYSLLPVNLLAALKLVLQNLANLSTLTRIFAVLTVLWSTTASTRLLEVGCGMASQRYLIAYPIAMLYSAFVLITIF